MSSAMVLASAAPDVIVGASVDEVNVIRKLVSVWEAKHTRNVLRGVYFDGKMPLKPTGNIPREAYDRISAVLGWPSKAVTALAQRTVFDGFVSSEQAQDPFDLVSTLDQNRFDLELPQAIVSAFKHSCSFITTAEGDTASGEPKVQIMARSAEWSSALWDKRRRRVSAYLAVTDVDDMGRVQAMDVYLPDAVLLCARKPSGGWVADRRPNRLGEVLAEPLAYDPQLDRPFGRSRISRAVMSITDHALSTIVRTEISADFYAAPRMVALGVAEDAFARGKWQAAIDRWFALTKDEDGDIPKVEQLAQMTMQPLTELYRMYASQFAGETGLPVSALGIVQDNPPSAESMYAAEKDLIVEARAQTRILGSALRQVARKTVMLRDRMSEPSDELTSIRANWLNPAFTSPVTAADALVKLNSVFPWMGDTEVALEYAGFTQAEVTRLLSDKKRAAGPSILDRVLADRAAPVGGEQVATPTEDAQALKAKFEALGMAVRAGVEPADAAARLGLAGIKLTGAVPVSLRQPEAEARNLEDK